MEEYGGASVEREPLERAAHRPAVAALSSQKWRIVDTRLVVSRALALADAAAVVVSGLLATLLLEHGSATSIISLSLAMACVATLVVTVVSTRPGNRPVASFPRLPVVLGRAGIVLAMLALALYIVGERQISIYLWICVLFPTLILVLSLVRAIFSPLLLHGLRSGRLSQNVIIYGAGNEGARVARELVRRCDSTTRLVAIVDNRSERAPPFIEGVPVHRGVNSLRDFLASMGCRELVIALPWTATGRVQAVCESIRCLPVNVRLAADILEGSASGLSIISGVPVLHLVDQPLDEAQRFRKRLIDLVASTALVLLLTPIIVCIVTAIKIDSPGPTLFRQRREGMGRTEFNVFKFRTMYEDQSDPLCVQQACESDPRVTRVGRFLRSTGLDELPQLFNVLRGEMSLVGPRPHAVGMSILGQRNADLVREYELRQAVQPGITGWAQINANRGPVNSAAMMQSRIVFDLYYIKNQSNFTDIKIMTMTAIQLFKDAVVEPLNKGITKAKQWMGRRSVPYIKTKFVTSLGVNESSLPAEAPRPGTIGSNLGQFQQNRQRSR